MKENFLKASFYCLVGQKKYTYKEYYLLNQKNYYEIWSTKKRSLFFVYLN